MTGELPKTIETKNGKSPASNGYRGRNSPEGKSPYHGRDITDRSRNGQPECYCRL